MTESTLSAPEYRALLKDVKKMVALSKKRPSDTKLAAYWRKRTGMKFASMRV